MESRNVRLHFRCQFINWMNSLWCWLNAIKANRNQEMSSAITFISLMFHFTLKMIYIKWLAKDIHFFFASIASTYSQLEIDCLVLLSVEQNACLLFKKKSSIYRWLNYCVFRANKIETRKIFEHYAKRRLPMLIWKPSQLQTRLFRAKEQRFFNLYNEILIHITLCCILSLLFFSLLRVCFTSDVYFIFMWPSSCSANTNVQLNK